MCQHFEIYHCECRPLACTSFSRWSDIEDGYPGIKGSPSISIQELQMSSCFWYGTWMHNDEYLQLSILIHAECEAISNEAAARPSHLQQWPNSTAMQPQGLAASQGKLLDFGKLRSNHQALLRKVDSPQVCQSFGLSVESG